MRKVSTIVTTVGITTSGETSLKTGVITKKVTIKNKIDIDITPKIGIVDMTPKTDIVEMTPKTGIVDMTLEIGTVDRTPEIGIADRTPEIGIDKTLQTDTDKSQRIGMSKTDKDQTLHTTDIIQETGTHKVHITSTVVTGQ